MFYFSNLNQLNLELNFSSKSRKIINGFLNNILLQLVILLKLFFLRRMFL